MGEGRKFEADKGTEDTMLSDNEEYVPIIEGVNKSPTLHDLMTYGKSLIESGSNVDIYVIDSPVSENSYQMPLTRILLRRRLIEAEEKGGEKEGEECIPAVRV